jgi:hypothetical protein
VRDRRSAVFAKEKEKEPRKYWVIHQGLFKIIPTRKYAPIAKEMASVTTVKAQGYAGHAMGKAM